MLAESHRRQIAPGGDLVRSRAASGASLPCGQGAVRGTGPRTQLEAAMTVGRWVRPPWEGAPLPH